MFPLASLLVALDLASNVLSGTHFASFLLFPLIGLFSCKALAVPVSLCHFHIDWFTLTPPNNTAKEAQITHK
ncbi:hypothetical protein Micbo1qcDRAFT_66468 [Microdochium bolleyi]|uniref:Uncharacterized protein n=1 Tax=Microdochium bolleyi TaxID=196109 RepID=A0A136J2X7_9PEZI|nr:hypothetical protein Micbo1qcDRAFT_66468 [Microdochium bolleyi]